MVTAKKEVVTVVAKPGATTKKNSNVRLYVKARFSGYRRSQTNIHPNESLINIDGVSERKEANFYLGKTVIYALPKKNGVAKMIKGKINRLHGNSGLVGARFERNLPSKPHGMRVMLYPSTI